MTDAPYDVLVIGAGGAGMATALSAAEAGARVIVIEKTDFLGGPYRANPGSMGIFAVGTRAQGNLHIDFSLRDAYRAFMEHSRWRTDGRVISTLIRESAGTVDWLASLGIEYDDVISYYTGGNLVFHARRDPGKRIVADAMEERARELGVEFVLETRVTALVTDGDRVVGVGVEDAGGTREIRSATTVIATGGYQGSPELIEKYTGLRPGVDLFTFEMFTHPQHQGEGLELAWSVGAAQSETMLETYLYLPDPYGGPGGTDPALSVFRQPGLLVNQHGLRFVDEAVIENPADAANALRRQPGSFGYMIVSAAVEEQINREGLDFQLYQLYHEPGSLEPLDPQVRRAVDSGYAHLFRADTIAQLAQQTGMDAEALAQTVAEYDRAAERGVDDLFFKDARYLRPLGAEGPFYAAKFQLGSYGSSGGIAIDEHGRVVDDAQRPIPGLYAGGRDANDIYGGTYPFSMAGSIQGFSYIMGRVTGRHAAAAALAEVSEATR